MTLTEIVFWLMAAAVAAPLLAQIPIGIRLPVVVIEVVLGILLGPHVLALVQFHGALETMFKFSMAVTLFMAGMELDFSRIRGKPLTLALGGWAVSLLIGFTVVALLKVVPHVHTPMMVTLALCTTGLGVLLPIFRDGGQLDTAFGRMVMAAGTVGEVAPIIAMSLVLSQRFSTWQEMGFLLIFLAIVGVASAVGMGLRPPRILAFLCARDARQHAVAGAHLAVVAGRPGPAGRGFGFEGLFGAFAAGMVVGLATRGTDGEPLRAKIDAVAFGWFYPFFFVGTGIKFNVAALVADVTSALLVPVFLRAAPDHSGRAGAALPQCDHLRATPAVCAVVSRAFAVDHRGDHRDRHAGKDHQSRRRCRAGRRGTAVGDAVPDPRRRTTVQAAIRRIVRRCLALGPGSDAVPCRIAKFTEFDPCVCSSSSNLPLLNSSTPSRPCVTRVSWPCRWTAMK